MKLSDAELQALHKLSFGNENLISNISRAGCFHCVDIFPTNTIEEWVEDEPTRTACCPNCHIDSVLAEDENVKLSYDLLEQMNSRYFCPEIESTENKYFNSFAELMAAYQKAKENSDTSSFACCNNV